MTNTNKFTAKKLAFAGAALALAFALSYVKLFHMPTGGSVTLLSMFFVAIVGYWYGPFVGLTAAFAYALLQFAQNPSFVTIWSVLFDYIFAFTALGLSGFFAAQKNGLIKGYIVGVLGRYFFSVLSGAIFFGAYAPDTFPNAWVYSLVYNGAYMGLEAAITIIVLLLPPVKKAMASVRDIATQK